VIAMSNYAKPPFDFWHWGESEDFVDVAQSDHWAVVARSLERDGDASAVIEFMRHQTKPILPGLAKVIARLWAGECFYRQDGWPLHVAGLKVLGPKCPPLDPDKTEKLRRAGRLASASIKQGVGKDKALKDAAKACGLSRIDEIRVVVDEWERWRNEE
jgi:hypothetical protein